MSILSRPARKESCDRSIDNVLYSSYSSQTSGFADPVRYKTLLFAALAVGLAISGWMNARSLAVAIFAQIPRSVAIKLVQGLTAIQGIGALEIDHRNGRYKAAIEHL